MRPARFSGRTNDDQLVMLRMPTTPLFGHSDGTIVVGGVEYEIRSDQNKLWLLDQAGTQRGFAELLGLKTNVTVGQLEFELKKFNLSDVVARVVYDGRAVGAITGNGIGKRKLTVDVELLRQAEFEAFLAVAAIAGWRDFRSTVSIATEGQTRAKVGYVPTPGQDSGGMTDWGDGKESSGSDGGGFWDGFGGGDGGGGGGGDGGGG